MEPQPKFYKSVIDDVIDGVQDVFAEEGTDEQVLKELQRRWESKVMQSKATEGFFRHRHLSPQFTLHLPHNFHQTLQTSAGVAAGRGIRQFTAAAAAEPAEVGPSRTGGTILSLPSGLAYPIQIPAGVTLQTASGHLYKVNMPVVVTQAPGGGTILQNPIQQIFQQLGQQPSAPQTASAVQVNASTLRAPTSESLQVQAAVAAQQVRTEEKTLPDAAAVLQEATWRQEEAVLGAAGSQQPPSCSLGNPQHADIPLLKPSGVGCPAEATAHDLSGGGELPVNLEQQLDPEDLIELIIMGNELNDNALLPDEANLSFDEELDAGVQMEPDLQTQKAIANDLEKIIQLDGTGDIFPKADAQGSPRDGEDDELVGIIDAKDLKVLDEEEEEEGENSTSDNQSLSGTSDTDEPSVDIIEEDPLNSGDDVSEQETPDVFDTDNIIVCQYDKAEIFLLSPASRLWLSHFPQQLSASCFLGELLGQNKQTEQSFLFFCLWLSNEVRTDGSST
ncbi:TFIIA-alpha and beta-like factor isoform X1 [Hemicordylus capensis]|uniref:TFIIA-alpha and beta-like factor isoform X1 n=1 Tax=Hemicordylus capensis TaxID=884348 RepID=UPI00230222DD|nr:TFIIA-alpha and beta-like factor isoform X1 [Hemicordylus capensis]